MTSVSLPLDCMMSLTADFHQVAYKCCVWFKSALNKKEVYENQNVSPTGTNL